MKPATLDKVATTHERVLFLGKNCSWTNLTSNNYNTIISSFKHQSTFWFFKKLADDLRVYEASQPPGRHARYFKTTLKILVDRALKHHISFLFDGISFDTHVLCFTSQ